MGRRRQIVPTLKFHPYSGHYYYWDSTARKRVGLGRDRERAERLFRGILNRLTGGQVQASAPLAPGEITVAELCLDFRRRVVPDYPDKRARDRFTQAIRRLTEFAAADLADSFTPQRLKDFRRHLMACRTKTRKGTGRPYARKTINYYTAVVKHIWRWAGEENLVRGETAYKIRLVKPLGAGKGGRETPRVPPVPDDLIDATLPGCSPIVAAMIGLQRSTGMRPGEVCNLLRGEISTCPGEAVPVPGSTIEARSDGNVWLCVPAQHKTAGRGKIRIIAIGKRGQVAIGGLIDRPADQPIFSPLEAARHALEQEDRPTEHLERMAIRGRYDSYSYGQAITRAVNRVNRERLAAGGLLFEGVKNGGLLEHWSPGRIRHTTGTAVREKFGRQAAAEFLGHAGTDMIDTYAEQAIATAIKIASEMG